MKELKQPLVSIGIPTFNRPTELIRILNQLINQTYKNIEIIILDNCSTLEEVDSIAKTFCANYQNVKYFKNPENIGVLRNASEVFKYATGKYFCWVADDDYRSNDFIQRLMEFLEANSSIACVFCNYLAVDENEVIAPKYPINFSSLMWFSSLKSRRLRRVIYYLCGSSWGKCNLFYGLYRTKILKQIDFRKISNDYTFLDMDSLTVYQILNITQIKVLDFLGCRFTVGNFKFYKSGKDNQNTFTKFLKYLESANLERKKFSKLSDPMEMLIITLFFPFKITFELLGFIFKRKTLNPFVKYH